jgi:hypothetical protein
MKRIFFNEKDLDCGGGSGSWNGAVCVQNAIMRYARTGEITDFVDKLKSCYWMQKFGCPEHCYAAKNGGKDVYIAAVLNSSIQGFDDHAICAEYNDNTGSGSKEDWENWTFFQYDNPDIQKGDQLQMPNGTPGPDGEKTRVQIKEVAGITSCGHYLPLEFPVVTFLIDYNSDVTVE